MSSHWILLVVFIYIPLYSATTTCTCNDQTVERGRSEVNDENGPTGSMAPFKAFNTPHFQNPDSPDTDGVLLLGKMREPFMGPRKRRKRNLRQQAGTTYQSSVSHPSTVQIITAETHVRNTGQKGDAFGVPSRKEYRNPGNLNILKKRSNLGPIPLKFQEHAQPSVPHETEWLNPNQEDNEIASAWREHGGTPVRHPLPHGQAPPKNDQRIYFQPTDSEWTTEVSRIGPFSEPIAKPTLFSRFLSSYIDFELKHYEIINFFRKTALALLVLGLGGAWILLGIFFKIIPPTLSIYGKKRNLEEGDFWGNAIVKEIRERVSLALDDDWLMKLEEKVSSRKSGWLATSVSCCISPSDTSVGQADCEVIRKGRKVSKLKCLSDLIYNFNFGPSDSGA